MEVQYSHPYHSKRLILRVISPGTEVAEPVEEAKSRPRRKSEVGQELLNPADIKRRGSFSGSHFL